jgi:D-alanyl-D-alanine carboxypeptidase
MRFALALVVSLFALPAFALPSITLDLTSGRVLQQNKAFDPWYPASLTKLMSAYVIFREIEAGRMKLDEPVIFTREAVKAPPSRIGYRSGTTMTLEDGLKLLLIKSANDMAIALAQAAGGTVPAFAGMMNQEAKRLGMNGSRWVNPHGLHDAGQFTTARDIAVLLQAIHREFPQYQRIFDAPSLIAPQFLKGGGTRPKVHFTYNLLLERFDGADGFKTGFVCASGYNFAGAATRDRRRIAAIVFGRDSQTSRAVDAAKLITEGFAKPANSGTLLAQLTPVGAIATAPRNMRPLLCTQEARQNRYDPGAGQAVIESQWLRERRIDAAPLVVRLLPRSAVPPSMERIPLPTFRPQNDPAPKPKTIDGVIARRLLAGEAINDNVPLPTFRPAANQ